MDLINYRWVFDIKKYFQYSELLFRNLTKVEGIRSDAVFIYSIPNLNFLSWNSTMGNYRHTECNTWRY